MLVLIIPGLNQETGFHLFLPGRTGTVSLSQAGTQNPDTEKYIK